MKKKYKDEDNVLMQCLVELIMNNLNGIQIRKGINQFYKSKSEPWMQTKYDDIVLDYCKLPNKKYIVKMRKTMG